MNLTNKACIAITLTALTAAAGADPTNGSDDPRGYAPPERFTDGRLNHQLDPANPFVMMPLDAMPKDIVPVIVAGDPGGTPADSPANRIDPNVLSSAYAGTAQLFIGGSFLCSATVVSDRFLVTANHCVDSGSDGGNDFGTNIRVTFNANGNGSTVIFPSGVTAVYPHPDYTGFGNPNINDDITLIELDFDLPAEITRYPVYRGSLSAASVIQLVGYGTTGDAVNGYINGTASFNNKRRGRNNPDRGFFADDEGAGTAEIFQFDFDNWQTGGLGNDIETTVGGGDSGGPSYILVDDHLELWGVNTFTAGNAPAFGSIGGGILVNAYLDFIDQFIDIVPGNFALNSPACGAVNEPTDILLDWENSSPSDTYTLTIADDPALTNVVLSQAGIFTSDFSVADGVLSDCTTYYWSVSAVNSTGVTVASNAVCSFSTATIGDINGDGVVDTSDLGGLVGSFGGNGPFGDINNDGIVDTADLGLLLGDFGQNCN